MMFVIAALLLGLFLFYCYHHALVKRLRRNCRLWSACHQELRDRMTAQADLLEAAIKRYEQTAEAGARVGLLYPDSKLKREARVVLSEIRKLLE